MFVGSDYYSQNMSSLCIQVNRLGAIEQINSSRTECHVARS